MLTRPGLFNRPPNSLDRHLTGPGIGLVRLGSFGGWGLVAGPMAWLAAIVAGRFNLIARVVLLLPISVLLLSWKRILFSVSSVSGDLFS